MSMNAHRYTSRKTKRPDWNRSNRAKKARPTDIKARNRNRVAHCRATANYRGELV